MLLACFNRRCLVYTVALLLWLRDFRMKPTHNRNSVTQLPHHVCGEAILSLPLTVAICRVLGNDPPQPLSHAGDRRHCTGLTLQDHSVSVSISPSPSTPSPPSPAATPASPETAARQLKARCPTKDEPLRLVGKGTEPSHTWHETESCARMSSLQQQHGMM